MISAKKIRKLKDSCYKKQAPEYFESIEDNKSNEIQRKAIDCVNFLNVRVRKLFADYCIIRLKQYGYKVFYVEDKNIEDVNTILFKICW